MYRAHMHQTKGQLCFFNEHTRFAVGTGAAWQDGEGPLWSSAVFFLRDSCRSIATNGRAI